MGEVEEDIVEAIEVVIEAMGVTVPIIEHEAGELFLLSIVHGRLSLLIQRTREGILTLIRNVGTLGPVFLPLIYLNYTLHYYIYSSPPQCILCTLPSEFTEFR